MVPLARGSGKEIGKGSGKHDRRAVKAQASSGRKSFGGVPERSKGSDCKSDGYAFEGSNPSPTTIVCGAAEVSVSHSAAKADCGYGSMVEPQPSKLKMRVRFPLPAPRS